MPPACGPFKVIKQMTDTHDVNHEKRAAAPKRAPQIVTADEADMRLDRWFRTHFPDVAQGHIQKACRTGQIRVDGKRAETSDRVAAGQAVRVPPPFYTQKKEGAPEGAKEMSPLARQQRERIDESRATRLKQMVLYQDDDVIVLNKPAGLAVQGGTGLRENLDDALMALSKDGKTKPKLVHRLDRDTSGVLLVARTDFAARKLTEAFRDRATQKIYWAVTLGVPLPERGRISAPLVKRGETMQVDEEKAEDAKKAVTVYQVMETALKKAAFVALWPITGRTHQLRVHLSYIGTPILGDRLYGGVEGGGLPREELGAGLHLHARRLILPHPRRGMIDITAPLSGAMKKTWSWFNFDAQAEVDFDDAVKKYKK